MNEAVHIRNPLVAVSCPDGVVYSLIVERQYIVQFF
jgi:hypothetical protein